MKDRLNNVFTLLFWISIPCFVLILVIFALSFYDPNAKNDLIWSLTLNSGVPVGAAVGLGFYYALAWPIIQYVLWGRVSLKPWEKLKSEAPKVT